MKTLKHEHLAVLKIDVEGFEWPVLRETIDSGVLGHVDQLLFEIHLWDGQGAFGSDDKRVEVLHEWHKIIADLENERGFRLFYVNTNPMSSQVDFKTGFSIPCCYEVRYSGAVRFMLAHNAPFAFPSGRLRQGETSLV